MAKAEFLKRIVLEISHDGIELDHRIADRRSGSKGDPFSTRNLVHVLALHKHVRTFLRVSLCDASHVSHFGIKKQVLVIVAFINKEPIHA